MSIILDRSITFYGGGRYPLLYLCTHFFIKIWFPICFINGIKLQSTFHGPLVFIFIRVCLIIINDEFPSKKRQPRLMLPKYTLIIQCKLSKLSTIIVRGHLKYVNKHVSNDSGLFFYNCYTKQNVKKNIKKSWPIHEMKIY